MATSNTIGGYHLLEVAQETLQTLLPKMPPADIFTTDFSNEVARQGQTVLTRLAAPTTAEDFVASTGYASKNAVSTTKQVSISKHKHITYEFKEEEVAFYGLQKIRELFMQPMANAVVKSLYDEAFSNVTAANFSKHRDYGNAAVGFDRLAVAGLAGDLTRDFFPENRTLLLSPTPYVNLTKDPAVAQAFSIGDAMTIRENKVGRIHGFNTYEYNAFPNLGDQESGKMLTGIACSKQALLVVARVPEVPTSGGGIATNVTDPATGFTFQLRYWFDWNFGLHKLTGTWLIGSGVGNADALYRLTETD